MMHADAAFPLIVYEEDLGVAKWKASRDIMCRDR